MLPTYRTGARSCPLPRRGYGLLLTAVVAGLAGGCAAEGGLELALELPAKAALSPTEAEIGSVGLVTYVPDQAPRSESRQVSGGATTLSMGRLDAGDGISLAVEMRAPNQRLVGYGRSPGPIDVVASQMLTVPINMRRPFVYVTGGTQLATFDSTRDAAGSSAYRGAIPLSRAPSVAAATADGLDVVVVSDTGNGAELSLVSTSTHEASGNPPVPLDAAPSDIAISPDSHWAVVGHSGAQGGLSIVDLGAARAGQAAVQFVPLGSVGAVNIGAHTSKPRVVALLDRATGTGCPTGGAASSVVTVSLEDPTQIGTTFDLGTPVRDIAVSDDGGFVFTADICNDQIDKLSLDDDVQPAPLLMMPQPTAVAVFDDRVWGVGTAPASGSVPQRLMVVSARDDGTGETRVELPQIQESARSNDFTGNGQAAEQRMDADALEAYDLAVTPGADHLAILVWEWFEAQEEGSFLGQPIIPAMTLESREYLLVNAFDHGARPAGSYQLRPAVAERPVQPAHPRRLVVHPGLWPGRRGRVVRTAARLHPVREPMTTRVVTAAIVPMLWLALWAAPAVAQSPNPKRRVAVLEFRAASAELPNVHQQMADILRKATSLDVIDVTAARRVYGDDLDRDIVRCAGNARCVARLGVKLKVSEVLLVGVSEFGDVILTLQRIRTRGGKVEGRIAEALAPGAAPDAKAVRAYLERVMPESDFLRYGTIRLQANVIGAKVDIDGHARGLTPVDPIKLPAPATYEIRVTKPGYTPFRIKVHVPPDAGVDVQTTLTTRGGDQAWYKKWWVAAIAGTVVVGAATATVMVTRGTPNNVPVVIDIPGAALRF